MLIWRRSINVDFCNFGEEQEIKARSLFFVNTLTILGILSVKQLSKTVTFIYF